MNLLRGVRRWWVRHFRTQIRQGLYNPRGGLVVAVNDVGLAYGWHVERPDWWCWGTWSGVTDATVEIARRRLDEWQDDMARMKEFTLEMLSDKIDGAS